MNQDVQIFTSTIVAVFLEASPFLLLGALISSVFEIYLPQDLLEKHLPRGRFLGLLFGLSAGMLVPTCECGVVPIARRLLKKNVPAHVAMTYMLSAPVINPVVLAATYVAFRGNVRMVLARVFVVAVCACCIGLLTGEVDPALLLRDGNESPEPGGTHASGYGSQISKASKIAEVLVNTASEFLDMGKFLILGALAVGFFKAMMVEELLIPFQGKVLWAVGGMMLLAVFLSICSEADAFVAASFSSFPGVAQLSFMALGPMVDLKLIFMYGSVFRKRTALILILLPIDFVFALSLLLRPVIG
jgi:uncharacterized membrane protein YraQ (UPF0718 family)